MVSQNLLEFAAKNYDFNIDSFKIEYVHKWGNPPREIHTFNKDGKKYIIHFDDASQPVEYIRRMKADMDFICYLVENDISVARPLRTISGEFVISTKNNAEDYIITAFEMVNGEPWNKNDPSKWNNIFCNWGKTMGNMHRISKDYKSEKEYGVQKDIFESYYWDSLFERLKVYPVVYKVTQKLLGDIKTLPKDRDSFGLVHGDMHQENFYIDGEDINIFDFGDSMYGWFAMDIGIALFHALWWGRKDDAGNNFTNVILENFLEGYLSANHLSDFWLSKIPMFMKYRQVSAFIPWFFNPEDREESDQREWKYNIKNDILFDGITLKYISDVIGNIKPKQGKVIVIGGCPRAGKTTLSVRLVKSGKGFSKISGDYLGESIDAGLHEHKGISANKFEFIKLLLEKLIHDAEVYEINSVFDYCSYDFTPEDIERLPFRDKLEIYFFGFPDIPASEIRYAIKHYAKYADWISHVDDDYIGEVSEKIYAHNIILKQQCEKYGYRFVNTGVGKDRSVALDSLYDEIIGGL